MCPSPRGGDILCVDAGKQPRSPTPENSSPNHFKLALPTTSIPPISRASSPHTLNPCCNGIQPYSNASMQPSKLGFTGPLQDFPSCFWGNFSVESLEFTSIDKGACGCFHYSDSCRTESDESNRSREQQSKCGTFRPKSIQNCDTGSTSSLFKTGPDMHTDHSAAGRQRSRSRSSCLSTRSQKSARPPSFLHIQAPFLVMLAALPEHRHDAPSPVPLVQWSGHERVNMSEDYLPPPSKSRMKRMAAKELKKAQKRAAFEAAALLPGPNTISESELAETTTFVSDGT